MKKKDENVNDLAEVETNNENENVSGDGSTDLTVREDQTDLIDSPQAFLPTNREQVEMAAHLNDLRATLEAGIEKTTKPSLLADAGTIFNIVDAYHTTMMDDIKKEETQKIVFILVDIETGEEFRVMQSNDSKGIRRKYADYFSYYKAASGGMLAPPLEGFHFVYGTKIIAGNAAIILEKVRIGLTVGA